MFEVKFYNFSHTFLKRITSINYGIFRLHMYGISLKEHFITAISGCFFKMNSLPAIHLISANILYALSP